jgi:hypothetical protein
MTKKTSRHLDATWRAFGDVSRGAREDAHREAVARAIRQAMLTTAGIRDPEPYRAADAADLSGTSTSATRKG